MERAPIGPQIEALQAQLAELRACLQRESGLPARAGEICAELEATSDGLADAVDEAGWNGRRPCPADDGGLGGEPPDCVLLDAMLNGCILWDVVRDGTGNATDFRYILVNQAFERLTGLTRADVLGRCLTEVLPDTEEYWIDAFLRVVQTGEPVELEDYHRQLDRHYHVFAFRVHASRIACIFFETTRLVRAQRALNDALTEARSRRAETEALLEAAHAVMASSTFDAACKAIHQAARRATGADAGYIALLTRDGAQNEVIYLDAGRQPCTVDPALPMPIRGLRELVLRTRAVRYENDFPGTEWVRFLPPGHSRIRNVLFAPLTIDGQAAGLLGLANKPGGFDNNDARLAHAFAQLTATGLARTRALEQLRTSEDRFRSVVQTANDAIIAIDRTGSIVFWNAAAEAIFGYTEKEALGQSLAMLMPRDLRKKYDAWLHEALAALEGPEGSIIEASAVRSDGSQFPVEVSASRWQTSEGVYFTGIVRDVTERTRAAERLERTISELERSNADLELFASVASHDLREPLRAVTAATQLLARRYEGRLDADADRLIAQAVEGAARMAHLVEAVLSYSRAGAARGRLAPTDVGECLRNALRELQVGVEEAGARIEADPLPVVMADAAQLSQLLQNLIGNALRFRGDRRPRIRISAAREGTEWVFSVGDNGIGVAPDDAERIFDAFKRLHGRTAQAGAGMGLAVSKRIVERHGGRIWVEPNPGQGSTFCFAIPALEEPATG